MLGVLDHVPKHLEHARLGVVAGRSLHALVGGPRFQHFAGHIPLRCRYLLVALAPAASQPKQEVIHPLGVNAHGICDCAKPRGKGPWVNLKPVPEPNAHGRAVAHHEVFSRLLHGHGYDKRVLRKLTPLARLKAVLAVNENQPALPPWQSVWAG